MKLSIGLVTGLTNHNWSVAFTVDRIDSGLVEPLLSIDLKGAVIRIVLLKKLFAAVLMKRDLQQLNWPPVFNFERVARNTSVFVPLGEEQVATFRMDDMSAFGIGKDDPRSGPSVRARRTVASLSDRVVVASPICMQHFDLRTGDGLKSFETPGLSYSTKIASEKDGIAQ